MNKRAVAVKRRIKYELTLAAVLALLLIVVLLPRDKPEPRPEFVRVPAVTLSPDAIWALDAAHFEYTDGKWAYVKYGEGSSTNIDVGRFSTPEKKTNKDLVQFALQAWENQWGYVWGTFGDVLTEERLTYKLEQYPQDVGEAEDYIREHWLNRRTVDCMGIIKGYGWYDPDTGAINYNSGAMRDTTTEGMFNDATVKGPIDTMPDTPGLIVYAVGHVGVYVGDGEVIESISTVGGVVKTLLSGRNWTHWMQCPDIEY